MSSRPPSSLADRVTHLEASQLGQDRELRDLKLAMDRVAGKLDTLNDLVRRLVEIEPDLKQIIDTEIERRGAMKLGRWAVGGGFLAVLGSAIAGVWQFFRGVL